MNDVTNLNSEDYGKEYLEALQIVMDIRKDRKKIYGDSFKDEKFENLMAIVDGKFSRLHTLLKTQNLNHPKIKDEIADIINYLIFQMTKLSIDNNVEEKI